MEKLQNINLKKSIKVNFVCCTCARKIDMELPDLDYGGRIKDGMVFKDQCDICKCLGDLLFEGNKKVALRAAYILSERRKPITEDIWSDYRI